MIINGHPQIHKLLNKTIKLWNIKCSNANITILLLASVFLGYLLIMIAVCVNIRIYRARVWRKIIQADHTRLWIILYTYLCLYSIATSPSSFDISSLDQFFFVLAAYGTFIVLSHIIIVYIYIRKYIIHIHNVIYKHTHIQNILYGTRRTTLTHIRVRLDINI